jgi:hypothetical protein
MGKKSAYHLQMAMPRTYLTIQPMYGWAWRPPLHTVVNKMFERCRYEPVIRVKIPIDECEVG